MMLLTDGFGGVGGIAKFNRDFLAALNSCEVVERITALPRLIVEKSEGAVPEAVVYDRRAARSKIWFILRVLALIWRGTAVDLVVCGHLYLLPLAWLLARARSARLVLIIHGIEAWKPSGKLLADRLARSVDGFISVSRYSAQRFIQWSRISMSCAFILPNCVDLDRFRPQARDVKLLQRYGLTSNRVILTVGRLAERYKGFDQVIDLMPALVRQFPSLKYLIAGDGPDRRRLEAKVRCLGLEDRVLFVGFVPETEKVAHYNLADAYVMPSTGEGFGIVLIEAAACGVPTIGGRNDGSREALLDGELGLLVDPAQPDELMHAITSVLEAQNPRHRPDAIQTFSNREFNSRMVDWCRLQLAHT